MHSYAWTYALVRVDLCTRTRGHVHSYDWTSAFVRVGRPLLRVDPCTRTSDLVHSYEGTYALVRVVLCTRTSGPMHSCERTYALVQKDLCTRTNGPMPSYEWTCALGRVALCTARTGCLLQAAIAGRARSAAAPSPMATNSFPLCRPRAAGGILGTYYNSGYITTLLLTIILVLWQKCATCTSRHTSTKFLLVHVLVQNTATRHLY